jgi:hypothetical protein
MIRNDYGYTDDASLTLNALSAAIGPLLAPAK